MNQRNVYEGSLTPELNPLALERDLTFPTRPALSEIIGQSEAMERVFQTVEKVRRSDSPVLIYGESGTGKELIARAIHRLSPRASGRFVAINCSAIPENLLESELFGYVKGAFTGADKTKNGFFAEAAGGTLFLDEIGDMPLALQVKILRVIQEKQFTPVGDTKPKMTDVRLITATNIELDKAIQNKKFRQDLYYRLVVLPIHLPPLRERQGDIRLLTEHFLDLARRTHIHLQPCYLSPEAYHCLERYDWPGNVRELHNLIERLVVMSGGGMITAEDLPFEYRQNRPGASIKATSLPNIDIDPDSSGRAELLPADGINLETYIEELENALIMQALERTGNNKNQAAKLLGLNRTTLVERIKKRKLMPLNAPSKEL